MIKPTRRVPSPKTQSFKMRVRLLTVNRSIVLIPVPARYLFIRSGRTGSPLHGAQTMAHPIPAGHHAITPHLVIKGAAEAIDFYKRAFGAEELSRMPFPSPDGSMKLGHAELKIGDSRLFLSDEFPDHGAVGPSASSPVTLHLYVTDADTAFAQAVEAGATVSMPPADMFWGDRYAKDHRPVRAPLVDRRASGRPHTRADDGEDGRRYRSGTRIKQRTAPGRSETVPVWRSWWVYLAQGGDRRWRRAFARRATFAGSTS